MANKSRSKRQLQRKGTIVGVFAWRLIEMLESPAHRALGLSARRVLDRLEIEFHRHGGKPEENGRLPCTYEHFVEFGIERHSIAPAIRELVALGFVEITRQGCAGNAGYRQPTLYRLTYRHAGAEKRITDNWRRIEAIEEAAARAKAARNRKPERSSKNRTPVRAAPIGTSAGKPTNRGLSPVRETPTTGPVRETPTTSIFRAGARSSIHQDPTDQATSQFGPVAGSFRITGRAEPVVLFIPSRPIEPLPHLLDGPITSAAKPSSLLKLESL